ncbi:MAG: PAS domain S-box protein [Syntrophaceae bacterium]|nr:PAS domain S-box protein [Syntrophaceae bacterium]
MKGNTIKILAIDDMLDNLMLLKAVVEDKIPGVRILTALNGRKGIDLARAEDPDVILLDIVMPDMDGYEVCRILKEDESLKVIPIIFLTGLRTDTNSRVKALEMGAEGFLTKPFDEVELTAQIKTMTKLKAATRLQRLEKEQLEILVAERTRELNRELSKRKRIEEALRESEDRYRQLFESESDAIFLIDNETGRILEANQAASDLYGYSREELLTKINEDLSAEPDQTQHVTHSTPIIQDRVVLVPLRFHRKQNGTVFPVEITGRFFNWQGRPVHIAAIRDITERRQAEKALQESEARYRSFFENAAAAVSIADLNGYLVETNETNCQFLGYSRPELIGMHFKQFTHPEDKDLSVSLYQSLIEGHKQGYELEKRYIHKDGKMMWGRLAASLIRDSQGSPLHTLVVSVDITEQKRAEDQILRNEMRLKSLIRILQHQAETTQEFLDNALGEAIKLTESSIGYIYFYHEDRKQFILNAWSENVLKKCMIDNPKTRYELDETGLWGEAVRQRKAIILNDFKSNHPLKKGCPKGHAHLTNFMTVPVFKGNHIVAVVGVANKPSDYVEDDVLQLTLLMDAVWKSVNVKEAEEAVHENEKRFRQIYQESPVAYQSLDAEGRILDVNPTWLTLFGYTREEIIGRCLDELFPPNSRAVFAERFPLFREHGVTHNNEFNMQCKDGTILTLTFNGVFVRDAHGVPLYSHCILHNITELKQSEETLKRTMKRLRQVTGSVIDVISLAVESRDPYTSGHQKRVSDLARRIASEMGLPATQIEGIRIAGIIHDLGKISVPSEILSMPRKLNEIEFSLLKTHAQKGYEILSDVNFDWPVAEIVYQHHERLDGSGYPRGLKKGDILLEAQIIAVADVVEAMASHRPYRPALGIEPALKEIVSQRGILFDPAAVNACIKLFKEKGFKFADS